MKKNLTKLLALMMALALVFSLAACGDKTEEQSTNPSDNQAAVSVNGDETVVPVDNSDPSAMNEDPSASDEETQTPGDTQTPGETQKPGNEIRSRPNFNLQLSIVNVIKGMIFIHKTVTNTPNRLMAFR